MIRPLIQARLCCLLLAGGLAMSTAQAQEGRFNLEPMAGGLEPKVNINFGPAMMAGFAESMASANPDLSTVLGGIQGLRLMVFEDLSDTRELASQIDSAVAELIDSGWNRAIQVKEDGEQVDLFMIESDQFVTGMVLMVRETSDTAVLANIHGEMDPVLVGRLVGSGKLFDGFDFDGMFNGDSSD
jgi:hypothetical protein